MAKISRTTAVATALLLGLAACGGSDVETAAAPSVKADYGVAATYLGGNTTAADTSKKPIKIGWVNEEGGSSGQPEASAGVRAAVALVNEHLGGVQGHRVELVECFVASSEEEAQSCAQQMYNDKDVSIVLTGSTSIAAGALHKTLAKSKPILGANPSSTASLAAKNAYYLGAGPFGQAALAKYLTDELHAKKIALIGPAFPGTTLSLKQLKQIADPAGATVTSGTYKQGSADVAPAVLASRAQTADAVLILEPNSNGCTAVAKALQQYSVTAPVLSLSSCADEATVGKSLGDLPGWTFPLPTLAPTTSVEDSTGEVAVYLSAMREYQPKSTVWGLAPANFALLMYAVKIMNLAGADASPATLSSAIADGTGPVFMAAPTLKYGGPLASIGSTAFRFYSYQGDGKWSTAANGKWIS